MPNTESIWCNSLYGEKFRLHVQARMVLALIPAEDMLQCEQSLYKSSTIMGHFIFCRIPLSLQVATWLR